MIKKIKDKKVKDMEEFGFLLHKSGVHTSRTIMFDELETLLNYVDDTDFSRQKISQLIEKNNCLKKRSSKSRSLTAKYLIELYGLDNSIPLFKAFYFLWQKDPEGRRLLALLYAYIRDSILFKSFAHIEKFKTGEIITRESFEQFLEDKYPNRFSEATLRSLAQNINSSWTKSGHLKGKVKKVRSEINPTIGPAIMALILGYIEGQRGLNLFNNDYLKVINCSQHAALEFAEEASLRGWITMRRIQNSIDITFSPVLASSKTVSQ